MIEHLISSLLVVQPSSRLSASAALNIPEIQNIRDKLHSKHSDIYKCQNLGLAISNDKSKSNRVSVSACDDRDYNRFEKDSSITEAESKLIENRIERNALNKLALGRRLQRERIRSVHGVRSLTPDLRREHTHNVRRQQSEPRRYSCGDGEQSKSRNGIALENMGTSIVNYSYFFIKNMLWALYLSYKGLQIREPTRKLFFLFLNQNICCGYSKEPSK